FREDFLEKIAINKTPLFIANANNGIDEILKTYEVPRDKLYCLPQYASLKFEDQDSSKIREQLKVDSDAIVIGMISHFRKEKLFDLLFDAFQELKVDRKIHLILSGDAKNSNDTNEKYKQLLKKENKSSNKITVLTNKSVSEILNVLDIGVLVSTIEGTPNVVMEYMLYGLPVIATNHIGCKELLNSDELVINNNIEELVLKLNFLIDNPGEAKRIGLNNQKEIQKYSKENYFKKLTSIISQNQLS
ncbi:MAG: glycosyltransferase family 4 protein, partial [Flavicella sp.]|nr:glycosyltransferase family 4 protein [Flavicella sp.]